MALLRLPEVVDISAEHLAGDLRAALAGGPVELDASAVRRIDASGLQLLCAAAVAARAAGGELAWRAPSPTLTEGARVLGLATALGLPLADT